VITCPGVKGGFKSGDGIEVNLSEVVRNVTTGKVFKAEPFPDFILGILNAGGLIPYLKKKGVSPSQRGR
jgi:3-isopropylmalate/(R)-2-methylmalate dehydratase small subunit